MQAARIELAKIRSCRHDQSHCASSHVSSETRREVPDRSHLGRDSQGHCIAGQAGSSNFQNGFEAHRGIHSHCPYWPGILRDQSIDGKQRDTLRVRLCPRIAAGLAPLMHLQLRVLEKTEVEKRLRKLERLMRERIMENRKGSLVQLDPTNFHKASVDSLNKLPDRRPFRVAPSSPVKSSAALTEVFFCEQILQSRLVSLLSRRVHPFDGLTREV